MPNAHSPGSPLDQAIADVVEDYRTRQFLQVYMDEADFSLHPAVPITSLDLHSALRAQVRPTAGKDGTLPHLVQRYVLMRQKDGTYAPPSIGHAVENGRVELLDGRQRVEAAKNLGMTVFPVYVITTDDEDVLWKVALRANDELNGAPPSDEDVEQQILAYKATFPTVSNVLLATLFKRHENYVGQVLNKARVGERLESMGFKTKAAHGDDPEAKAFTPSILIRLAPLKDDSVLRAAAQLVKDAGMSNPMVADLVKEIGEQRSENDRLALIEEKRANGLGNRIRKVAAGVDNLPSAEYPVRRRLLQRAENLARDLSRYRTAAEAEMTDPKAASDLWGYTVAIEMSTRRIVGTVIRTK